MILPNTESLALSRLLYSYRPAFYSAHWKNGIAHGTTLLELGCELAQGYGIAKPMPLEQVEEWVLNWQSHDEWHL